MKTSNLREKPPKAGQSWDREQGDSMPEATKTWDRASGEGEAALSSPEPRPPPHTADPEAKSVPVGHPGTVE